MLKNLFQRPKTVANQIPQINGRRPTLPGGVRIYAIGDIHGRIDLLRELEGLIVEDARSDKRRLDCFLVYLGDFVDRGGDSRQVIDHLMMPPLEGFNRVLLRGNHDVWFRGFLDGESLGDSWIRFGGDATLLSYGVTFEFDQPEAERFEVARQQLNERVPWEHKLFLDDLELAFGMGDYYFCHAGVRPGVPLADQEEIDTDDQIELVERRTNATYLDTMGEVITQARPGLDPFAARGRALDVTAVQNGLWLNWARYADRSDLDRGLDLCDRIALAPAATGEAS